MCIKHHVNVIEGSQAKKMHKKLYDASLRGDVDALNALLHQDQLILDRLSLTGVAETPLHIAAMCGHIHFAILVLSQKPKLAIALDCQRRTPLHLASANGNLEMVQELLMVGGNDVCRFQDQDGLTPLHLAAMNEHLEVVNALVQANPEALKVISYTGETILHMSINYNRFEAFKVLVELWNEEELANITDQGGNSLLHSAAINKQTQMLNYLLMKPSISGNRNAVNKLGLTALDVLDQCPRDLKGLETQAILMEAEVLRGNDLLPISKSKPLPSSTQSTPKGLLSRTWARYLNHDTHWLEKQRGLLIVSALLVAAMAFHAGLDPPGGAFTDSQNGRYDLGNAVQTEVDMDRFGHFLTYNTCTMIVSLGIIFVLISGFPLKNKAWMWVLTLGTLCAVVCMVITYLKSVAMMSPDSRVNQTTLWICLTWMFVCGVMALIHTIFFVVWVGW